MLKIRQIVLLLACVLCANFVVANNQDSTTTTSKSRWDVLLNSNFLAIPTVGFQPETSWSFGVAGIGYYKFRNAIKTSDVSADVAYTLNKQWNANVLSTMYFGDNRWFLYTKIGVKKYPDYFYGIGNKKGNLFADRVYYSSENVCVTIQPQYYLTEHWTIGANVDFRWEKPTDINHLDSLAQYCSVEGLNREFYMLGLGVLTSYDSRDEQFYPHSGLFFKALLNYYEPVFGSTYRMGRFTSELRQFVPIYKDFIFAWQFSTDWTFGRNKPFQYLATLGGQDVARGLRRGKWRDDAMMNLQAEFRIPIWRMFKASVFASVGDVYNLQHWTWAVPKVGYGLGLRVAITQAKVNIRFDVARQNYGNDWSFYFTVKEAF